MPTSSLLAGLRRMVLGARHEGLASASNLGGAGLGGDGLDSAGLEPLAGARRFTLPDLSPTPAREDVGRMLHGMGAPVVVEDNVGSAPLRVPGSLIVVAAPHDAALGPAMALAEAVRGQLHTSGLIEAYRIPSLEGRREAAAARAEAAAAGQPVVVAYGLGRPAWTATHAASAERLRADQTWLVVDARHKHSDTAAWVAAVQTRLVVHALAVVGAAETSTPRTVERLGIPVGWTDQGPVWG
ncbi:hypothetical protein [Sinomonas albida]|uniref:hypothetical protein n=1 Tax=Sinomonas albida TaxID=369942 RepID=UPI0010A9423D|nr:hypothetical protein [Sinomonas albida]